MESRLSWYRAVESAKEFDTWVICQRHTHDGLGRELQARPEVDGLTICELPPTPQWTTSLSPLFYFVYHRYQKQVLALASEMHSKHAFDLVHQVSFCGYREPGYLWTLDAPFVWGPVGGTQNFPWRFLSQLSPAGAALELSRNIVNRCHLRFRRRVHEAARRSAHVFAANITVQRALQHHYGIQAEIQLETGLKNLPHLARTESTDRQVLKIMWSGRFCDWKAFPLLLRGLATIQNDVTFELRVLGYGPHRARWEKLAVRLGLKDRVRFLDWPDRYQDQLVQYEWPDVLVFTSLRDTSGTGLLEALAYGCPIIAVDHQGAADIVTEHCGIKVNVARPADTIRELAAAVRRLNDFPQLYDELSRGAQQRARDYTWEKLGARMRQVYHQLINRHSNDGQDRQLTTESALA